MQENPSAKDEKRKARPTISQIVQKNKLNQLKLKKNEILPGQREYRLISGGDDGMVKWWNIVYTPTMPTQRQ
jgi:hypothetical protein